MKRIPFYLFMTFAVMCCLLSCRGHHKDGEYPSVIILDSEWPDTVTLKQAAIYRNAVSILASCWGKAIPGISFSPIGIFNENYPVMQLPQAEQFVVERIRQRTSPIVEHYKTVLQHKTSRHVILNNIYIRNKPIVYADKALFGKNPGDDLSSFFVYYSGTALVKCTGPDYKVVDDTNVSLSRFTDFFSVGTMMPTEFCLVTTSAPGELYTDDNVTLTFIFPVTVEHYWSWLLEQYDNPDAEESFTEKDMILTVSLKDLKKFDTNYNFIKDW